MEGELGALLPAWSALPFVGMLLSIALLPLLAPLFWHHHFPKVTAGWALVLLVPFLLAHPHAGWEAVAHTTIVDYVPFLILIATLFTIGGGIHVRGGLRGTPAGNATLLAIGTFLASLVGTTGAAMLVIRPLLRANEARRHRAHTVVFFIFMVANIGGALTPLGDPPLFLGFLHGVPFFWTLAVAPEMLTVGAIVLGVYLLVDTVQWRREDAIVRERPDGPREPIRLEGALNLLFLAGVLAAVIASGLWHGPTVNLLGAQQQMENLLRDAILVAMLAGSWLTTPAEVRTANGFSWGPIREVAILFAGIFVTIIPVMAALQAGPKGAFAWLLHAVTAGDGAPHEAAYFWLTGILSAFLDNAPTYLVFFELAGGDAKSLMGPLAGTLAAISMGAVYMGALTYIGNAPNLMVYAIASEQGVRMPSFFGYLLWTACLLVPLFVVLTLLPISPILKLA